MEVYSYDKHVAAFPHLTTQQRQLLGVEPSGAFLQDDGVAGPRTRSGLFVSPVQSHALLVPGFRALLAGAREDASKGNNDGVWPALFYATLKDEAFTPADKAKFAEIEQGAWCAAFVSWCIREAYGAGWPQAWGARRLTRRWAAQPGCEVILANCRAGDLICWRRHVPGEPAAGHIGVVIGQHGDLVFVLEGNGTRQLGAVGVYAYSITKQGERGRLKPQKVIMVARR